MEGEQPQSARRSPIPVHLPIDSPWTRSAEMIDGLAVTRLRRDQPGPLRAALLADTHIGADPTATFRGDFNPAANSAAAVEPALRFEPEVALFLGDLAWGCGEDGDYQSWRKLFAPLTVSTPTVFLPGNHDRRDRMLQHFWADGPAEAERVISIVETPVVRLIGLDSLYRTDVVPGLLGEKQRAWLERFLAAEDARPTVVLVHHHIGEDDYALLDGDRLLRLLAEQAHVKALFTAHRHAYRRRILDRLHCIAAPALGMPFEPEERLGWLEATFDGAAARLRFRGVDGRGDEEEVRLDWLA